MRRTYPRSDETFKVLSKNEGIIANEADWDVSHVNRIKNGNYPDPYPPFRELFRFSAYAGAPADIWLNDLNGIWVKAKSRVLTRMSELSAKVLEKIQSDAQAMEKIFSAVADGKLSEAECHEILAALAKNAETNQQIREAVLLRLGEINEKENRK